MKDCIEEGEEPEEESPVPLESSESPAILPQQSEFDLLSLNKEFKDPNTTCFVSISLRKLITALPTAWMGEQDASPNASTIYLELSNPGKKIRRVAQLLIPLFFLCRCAIRSLKMLMI